MFLIGDRLVWSASDLTVAAKCEYALLRRLDVLLKRAKPAAAKPDPLMDHVANLGDAHEARILARLKEARTVVELDHVQTYGAAAVQDAARVSAEAFQAGPDVVFQAAFFDGEFFGYADFIEQGEDGWVVCDAKLARHAKPEALLQLGAYVDQLIKLGLPVSESVSLLLGSGKRADFRIADVIPIFEERRERLRTLIADHTAATDAAGWGDDSITACGSCAECKAAIDTYDDVLLVSGLRGDQRRKLRAAGIATVAELAKTEEPIVGMARATFERLQAQAAIQAAQEPGEALRSELRDTAAKTLVTLPAPSEGDLFFDFEGDPLYDEGDPANPGLEYLWGYVDARRTYTADWAHSHAEEKAAFVRFIDGLVERRQEWPDLHVYHYAPYETTALKRLAATYQTREKELDDILRSEVFVDLYAVVLGSVRVASSSYSIKKLEPLYMGDELRSDDDDAVGDGGASVVAYHEYRDWARSEPERAQKRLESLADYNEYDCVSTLRLREWLLEQAEAAGVRDQILPRALTEVGEELSVQDPVFQNLMARSGPEQRSKRAAEEQAYAMLANAIDYYRREGKQFWWSHFERLTHPIEAWAGTRDVFTVDTSPGAVEIVSDWALEGRARNPRRVLRLTGDWAPGSTPKDTAQALYPTPAPTDASGPDGALFAARDAKFSWSPDLPRTVMLTESCKPEATYADLPAALAPGIPPNTKTIEQAIRQVATEAAEAPSLPSTAVIDVLTRRAPRLREGAHRQSDVRTVDGIAAALLAMDDSYLAVQGPPGTGKTWTASRVIKELVEQHHWRIGVVAQSHAVVENLLAGIVSAGLDPALVGKNSNDRSDPTWTALAENSKPRAVFLAAHAETGCVLGGTAWTYAAESLIEPGGLDLLVIDEAGQFALAPTIGASVAAKRLLLLGDPQQLPQVSQGTHAEPIDESALGWLMDGHKTLPNQNGYFLEESWRMHPAVCAKVSTLSYDGRLASTPHASERSLEGVEPGVEIIEVAHTGNRVDSPEEAARVVDLVRHHIGQTWTTADGSRPLAAADVLVVAPYNAQVALIKERLKAAGLGDVPVGTVDKFQGQEAPVTILSMTASSQGDVPRGMGFLLSRNRINVAISRAQWKAYVLRSPVLTSYMPSSAMEVLDLGAFIGLGRKGNY